MLLGAAWSAVAAVVLVRVAARERRLPVLLTCALAAFLLPLAWNTILRTTGATGAFSHDLRFEPFPISWQDTGTGVFTFAGAALGLAVWPARRDSADRAAMVGLLTAVGALVVDVYVY